MFDTRNLVYIWFLSEYIYNTFTGINAVATFLSIVKLKISEEHLRVQKSIFKLVNLLLENCRTLFPLFPLLLPSGPILTIPTAQRRKCVVKYLIQSTPDHP